jgi:DNA polymerase III sliding clamp (beta) subunit (PCNA family)
MSETQQIATFADEYSFEIDGSILRPFRQLVSQVLSGRNSPEYEVDLTDNGLQVEAVDKMNVILVSIELDSLQFETYDVDETTLGIPDESFGQVLQHARYGKRSSDMLKVNGDDRSITTTVEREIEDTDVTLSERAQLLDPNSVREKPDIPTLDMDAEMQMPAKTFIEILKKVETKTKSDVLTFKFGSNGLTIGQEGDTEERVMHIHGNANGNAESLFSPDYIERIQKALHVGRVDTVTLKNKDGFPIQIEFEREGVYSGMIMLSPRVGE